MLIYMLNDLPGKVLPKLKVVTNQLFPCILNILKQEIELQWTVGMLRCEYIPWFETDIKSLSSRNFRNPQGNNTVVALNITLKQRSYNYCS